IWFLYSSSLRSIVAAYDVNKNLVTPREAGIYQRLLELGSEVGDLLAWSYDHGKQYRDFFNKKTSVLMRMVVNPRKDQPKNSVVSINGRLINATEHNVRYKRTLLNRILGGLLGSELRAALALNQALRLYTVPTAELGASRLPELLPGQTM